MATIQPVKTELPPGDGSTFLFTWTLASGDVGGAIDFSQWADRSVQFVGTWSTGTAVFEGSNDGTNYFTLTDPQTTAISKTGNGLEQVVEVTAYARPSVTTVTSVVCSLLVRRQNPMRT